MPIITPMGFLPHTAPPLLDPSAPVLARQAEKRMQWKLMGGQTKRGYLGLFAGEVQGGMRKVNTVILVLSR